MYSVLPNVDNSNNVLTIPIENMSLPDSLFNGAFPSVVIKTEPLEINAVFQDRLQQILCEGEVTGTTESKTDLYKQMWRNGRRVGKNPLHCIFFSNSAYYFGMRIGNFVDKLVEYPPFVHKLFKEKMNWSVSVAPLNSNYKLLRLAIPFVFIHITCPLQRTMLLKAGMGSGEWDWGMGLGVGNGKVEWRVGHGELGMGIWNGKLKMENCFFLRGMFFLSVLWDDFTKNKYFPFVCRSVTNKRRSFSLNWILNEDLSQGLKIGEYRLGDIHGYPPVLGR